MREVIEQNEYKYLSERATKSKDSKGRLEPEQKCDYRTDFQRDRDRIIHSKAFRRLMYKTQVFLNPEGDHYRTRLTHSLEVSQISRAVARGLGLNEDLTEAIALGHDMGHTPYGHAGEDGLDAVHEGGFQHPVHSLRIADYLEFRGDKRGLNLTFEVRDGILNHSGSGFPSTLEGQIVRLCDRVAYINHDIDDSLRAGLIKREQLPTCYSEYFGKTKSECIGKMIIDIVENSKDSDRIAFSPEADAYFTELRQFMFKNVYLSEETMVEKRKVKHMIIAIYEYYMQKPEKLPAEYFSEYQQIGNDAIRDYIAGMTDRYCSKVFEQIMIPKNWRG